MEIDLGKIKIHWRGEYDSTANYEKDDAVAYDGSSFICIADSTISDTAPVVSVNTSSWDILASGIPTMTAQGQIVYQGDAGVSLLAPGTTGDVLSTGGTNANPSWMAPSLVGITGEIRALAHDNVPYGWFECDGAALDRQTYADLFALIGTTYGNGDEISTFNIPNLRGEFLRGWSNGRSVDSGRALGSWQTDEFKSHRHAAYYSHFQEAGDGTTQREASGEGSSDGSFNTSAVGGDETRPRNVAVVYIIKW